MVLQEVVVHLEAKERELQEIRDRAEKSRRDLGSAIAIEEYDAVVSEIDELARHIAAFKSKFVESNVEESPASPVRVVKCRRKTLIVRR